MALSPRDAEIVAQIAKRYGDVIDLRKSPAVLIEILRDFSIRLDPPGVGGTGGVGTVSTVAVGITPPTSHPSADLTAIMKGILKLQRDVSSITKAVAARPKAKRR